MVDRGWMKYLIVFALLSCFAGFCAAEDAAESETIDVKDQGAVGSATDSETVIKEAEAMSSDGFNAKEQEELESSRESFGFQAEVARLMDIIINSLYSNREIFIRELISNSADALDKIRFKSLTDSDVLGDTTELDIKIKFDKQAKTITLTDTGIGMTKQELIDNLGTVAKSGTTDFIEAAIGGGDTLSLIGQFGVGFYSVFLAAEKVTVISKNNNDPKQHIWESTASSEFTVSEDPRGNTLGRGTSIVMHLKEDAEEFLNEAELENIVTRYSQFINFPISLYVSKTVDKEVPVEEEEVEDEVQDEEEGEGEGEGEDDDLDISEEEDEDEVKKPKTKTVTETIQEWKRLNDVKAIWTRTPSSISSEEYDAFYESLTSKVSDSQVKSEGYLDKTHFIAEGEITFKTILYIPNHAARGIYDNVHDKNTNLKLYVRKVLIADSFDDFLPRYLNFIHGIVDSDDLPLNVARETLAQSRVLKVMSKKIVRKVLEMLRKMAERGEEEEEDDEDDDDDEDDEEEEEDEEEKDEDEEQEKEEKEEVEGKDDYKHFWKVYSKSIKLGMIDDRKNKSKLAKLLRFLSSKSGDDPISLESYVDRMKDDQKHIYYITGESLEYVQGSPFLERLKKMDYEVLYMVDAIDEYVVQQLTEFDGVQLASVTKDNLKLGDEDAESFKSLKDDFKPLTEWLKSVYDDDVEKVVVSNRIHESPCVLVTGQYGWTANMERIMRAQTLGRENSYMSAKKTMEINPYHPILVDLKTKTAADGDDESLKNLARLLYDSALMASGFQISETALFSKRIYEIVSKGLGIDPNAEVPEEVMEEEAEGEEGDEEEEETEEAVDVDESTQDSGATDPPSHEEL